MSLNRFAYGYSSSREERVVENRLGSHRGYDGELVDYSGDSGSDNELNQFVAKFSRSAHSKNLRKSDYNSSNPPLRHLEVSHSFRNPRDLEFPPYTYDTPSASSYKRRPSSPVPGDFDAFEDESFKRSAATWDSCDLPRYYIPDPNENPSYADRYFNRNEDCKEKGDSKYGELNVDERYNRRNLFQGENSSILARRRESEEHLLPGGEASTLSRRWESEQCFPHRGFSPLHRRIGTELINNSSFDEETSNLPRQRGETEPTEDRTTITQMTSTHERIERGSLKNLNEDLESSSFDKPVNKNKRCAADFFELDERPEKISRPAAPTPNLDQSNDQNKIFEKCDVDYRRRPDVDKNKRDKVVNHCDDEFQYKNEPKTTIGTTDSRLKYASPETSKHIGNKYKDERRNPEDGRRLDYKGKERRSPPPPLYKSQETVVRGKLSFDVDREMGPPPTTTSHGDKKRCERRSAVESPPLKERRGTSRHRKRDDESPSPPPMGSSSGKRSCSSTLKRRRRCDSPIGSLDEERRRRRSDEAVNPDDQGRRPPPISQDDDIIVPPPPPPPILSGLLRSPTPPPPTDYSKPLPHVSRYSHAPTSDSIKASAGALASKLDPLRCEIIEKCQKRIKELYQERCLSKKGSFFPVKRKHNVGLLNASPIAFANYLSLGFNKVRQGGPSGPIIWECQMVKKLKAKCGSDLGERRQQSEAKGKASQAIGGRREPARAAAPAAAAETKKDYFTPNYAPPEGSYHPLPGGQSSNSTYSGYPQAADQPPAQPNYYPVEQAVIGCPLPNAPLLGGYIGGGGSSSSTVDHQMVGYQSMPYQAANVGATYYPAQSETIYYNQMLATGAAAPYHNPVVVDAAPPLPLPPPPQNKWKSWNPKLIPPPPPHPLLPPQITPSLPPIIKDQSKSISSNLIDCKMLSPGSTQVEAAAQPPITKKKTTNKSVTNPSLISVPINKNMVGSPFINSPINKKPFGGGQPSAHNKKAYKPSIESGKSSVVIEDDDDVVFVSETVASSSPSSSSNKNNIAGGDPLTPSQKSLGPSFNTMGELITHLNSQIDAKNQLAAPNQLPPTQAKPPSGPSFDTIDELISHLKTYRVNHKPTADTSGRQEQPSSNDQLKDAILTANKKLMITENLRKGNAKIKAFSQPENNLTTVDSENVVNYEIEKTKPFPSSNRIQHNLMIKDGKPKDLNSFNRQGQRNTEKFNPISNVKSFATAQPSKTTPAAGNQNSSTASSNITESATVSGLNKLTQVDCKSNENDIKPSCGVAKWETVKPGDGKGVSNVSSGSTEVEAIPHHSGDKIGEYRSDGESGGSGLNRSQTTESMSKYDNKLSKAAVPDDLFKCPTYLTSRLSFIQRRTPSLNQILMLVKRGSCGYKNYFVCNEMLCFKFRPSDDPLIVTDSIGSEVIACLHDNMHGIETDVFMEFLNNNFCEITDARNKFDKMANSCSKCFKLRKVEVERGNDDSTGNKNQLVDDGSQIVNKMKEAVDKKVDVKRGDSCLKGREGEALLNDTSRSKAMEATSSIDHVFGTSQSRNQPLLTTASASQGTTLAESVNRLESDGASVSSDSSFLTTNSINSMLKDENKKNKAAAAALHQFDLFKGNTYLASELGRIQRKNPSLIKILTSVKQGYCGFKNYFVCNEMLCFKFRPSDDPLIVTDSIGSEVIACLHDNMHPIETDVLMEFLNKNFCEINQARDKLEKMVNKCSTCVGMREERKLMGNDMNSGKESIDDYNNRKQGLGKGGSLIERVKLIQRESQLFNKIQNGVNNKQVIFDDYHFKGDLLLKKCCSTDGGGNPTKELKIFLPDDKAAQIIQIYHSECLAHAPEDKLLWILKKHFSPIDNLLPLIRASINQCQVCQNKK